jgi:hypothetical protein
MPRPLATRIARRMAKDRKTHSGGRLGGSRKRNAERCPCQAMTLARAMARGRTATAAARVRDPELLEAFPQSLPPTPLKFISYVPPSPLGLFSSKSHNPIHNPSSL